MTFANDDAAILMATYQGERYINEQLISFEKQSYKNWKLIVSDDGSTDNTLSIIDEFATRNVSKVTVVAGPRKGFVSNFLSLVLREDIKADYYSFSDQDDIWYKDKLERAIQWLKSIPSDIPALYCSRTHLVDDTGKSLGLSPLFKRPPSFRNALVQNIGGGNTMVINQAAKEIISRAGVAEVISHDWWMYILISGVGGKIFYDPEPSLGYRQHGKNLIGSNLGFRARLCRFKKIMQGQYRTWNAAHIRELEKCIFLLSEENQKRIGWFKLIHSGNIFLRVYYFLRLGVYRQSAIDTVAIFISALLKKI